MSSKSQVVIVTGPEDETSPLPTKDSLASAS